MADRFWTRKLIARAIRELKRDGVRLSANAIRHDRTIETAEAICRATGRWVLGTTLHINARIYCGSWKSALEAAGLDPEKVTLFHPYWSAENVIRVINVLIANKISVRNADLNFDSSSAITKLVLEETGLKINGSRLVNAGRRYFGTWKRALKAAGVSDELYVRIKPLRKPMRRNWRAPLTILRSKKQIETAIGFIGKHHQDLKVKTIWSYHRGYDVQSLLSSKLARFRTRDLVLTSRSYHGNWREGVIQSGLDPKHHLKWPPRRKASGYYLHEHSISTEYSRVGTKTIFLGIGRIRSDPEEIFLNKEFKVRINSHLAKLPKKIKTHVELILDLVLSSESISMLEAIDEVLPSKTSSPAIRRAVGNVFAELGNALR